MTSARATTSRPAAQPALMPGWVPRDAQLYLAHTEHGVSMRHLAQQMGCHASTVMRRIRKLEMRRDDQLVDLALRRLGRQSLAADGALCLTQEERLNMPHQTSDTTADTRAETDKALEARAAPVLQDLEAEGTVLAVAADMEKAVIVDETAGKAERRAVVDRTLAEVLALQGWISCESPGRISRYQISDQGRAVLRRVRCPKPDGARPTGFSEAAAGFSYADPISKRAPSGETPLALLARRRDKSGRLFLEPSLVRAGERLREDFELAQISGKMGETFDLQSLASSPIGGSGAAQERMVAALQDLGPGLADVCLRCCCYLEGLETAEKRMGWSARSGKIVLRIALQRLRRHYDEAGEAAALIF